MTRYFLVEEQCEGMGIKMKKLITYVLVVVLMLTCLTACKNTKEAKDVTQDPKNDSTVVRVAALKGPTAMGLVKLMEDSKEKLLTQNYDFSIKASVDEITPLIIKGDVDIAAVPANLASVLYNNTNGQIKVLAVNTLGILYIVENGDDIHSIADLKGKTIYASGKGATPEYSLNYILQQNGIDPKKDVTIEYKAEHSECVALLASEKNAIAMLPQPFVTVAQTKEPNIKVSLDMNKEWEKLQTEDNNSALITGAVVVRTEFLKEHTELVNQFMDSYKESVDFVNNNVDEASTLIGKFDIVPAKVAKIALPYCNIVFIEGKEMKSKLGGYLSILIEQNKKAVGGSIPDDAFYYQK